MFIDPYFFKFITKTYTIELSVLISVWITLAFNQIHSVNSQKFHVRSLIEFTVSDDKFWCAVETCRFKTELCSLPRLILGRELHFSDSVKKELNMALYLHVNEPVSFKVDMFVVTIRLIAPSPSALTPSSNKKPTHNCNNKTFLKLIGRFSLVTLVSSPPSSVNVQPLK